MYYFAVFLLFVSILFLSTLNDFKTFDLKSLYRKSNVCASSGPTSVNYFFLECPVLSGFFVWLYYFLVENWTFLNFNGLSLVIRYSLSPGFAILIILGLACFGYDFLAFQGNIYLTFIYSAFTYCYKTLTVLQT